MLWNKQKKLNIFMLLMAVALLASSKAGGQSVDDSLVSWWPMEGLVEDIIGDNEPSETRGLNFVDGRVGQGVTFELPPNRYQHGGYIRIPDSDSLRLQRFTIEVWVQPAGPGGGPHDWVGSLIIGKRVSTVEAAVGLAWRSLDGRFVYRFGYDSASQFIISENTYPPLLCGEFYHVAGTYDGQTYKLFVNGQLEGSMVLVKTINYNDAMWQLGGGYFTGWPRTWNGVIDELRIYNRALTAEEIQARAGIDSDNDGLSDEDEVNIYGTDPFDPDTDADGLMDGTEVDMAEGSGCPDPLEPDSDGDTLTDGDEVLNLGTNPCNSDTDGDGVPDNEDPLPKDPGVTSGFIEDTLRELSDTISDFDLSLFDGKNDNARAGRRNALYNKVNAAANAVGANDIADAIDQLTSILAKVDGEPEPKDWMMDSQEKAMVRTQIELLIALLELL